MKSIILERPSNWNELPLYEKIKIYSKYLDVKHAPFVDKLTVKGIVKRELGDKVKIAKVIHIIDNWRNLKANYLDANYIIKSSHASGWNTNITSRTSYGYVLRRLQEWNQLYKPNEEIQYSYLKPRFFVEEKIEDKVLGRNGNCLVYMFRYIYEKLISIGVGFSEGNGIMKCNHYDEEWNLILPSEIPFEIPRPKKLQDMIDMSSRLTKKFQFEFVRIDFFIDTKDDIYFSEFTFTPKAGKQVFPLELEMKYGKLWT